ncbi:MAG: methyltransferase family protein [Candidatus Thorarchaeota archaeon]
MLNYFNVSLFIGINIILYAIVHIPLDYKTYVSKIAAKHPEKSPPHWKNNINMFLVLFSSFFLWILFLVIPFTGAIGMEVFYLFPIIPIDDWSLTIQMMGLVMISFATLIACWGRISRQLRAISWGIPLRLETQGMFKFIRHPLYASYCYYFLGFLFLFQSYFVLPLLLGIPGYYMMSGYEDQLLETQFGEEFRSYRDRTGRFFPKLMP